ncbi:hypothetical protein EB796_006693 [Bugula neritina]|uniref:Uncharacterized protein n=1 Tax=Bugula neritina TaxID=10212 RepID=A0A7J7K9Y8_BUGNE|nr:hypothetical protein EB796_006693 [Bugula neritina]
MRFSIEISEFLYEHCWLLLQANTLSEVTGCRKPFKVSLHRALSKNLKNMEIRQNTDNPLHYSRYIDYSDMEKQFDSEVGEKDAK